MNANTVVRTLYTCGHGTLSIEGLIALLQAAPITSIVDVRTVPKSRANPQFGKDALATSLTNAGINYRWEKDLGGFRKPRAESLNDYWRHPSFRGYADYMQTYEFWTALDQVLNGASRVPTAVLCSESVWWRCHRRMIADAAVLARGARVLHVFHDGRLAAHAVTEAARLGRDGIPTYPADPPGIVRPSTPALPL